MGLDHTGQTFADNRTSGTAKNVSDEENAHAEFDGNTGDRTGWSGAFSASGTVQLLMAVETHARSLATLKKTLRSG
jgi:hypothetical protein